MSPFMNLWSLLFIVLAAIYLMGFVALAYCAKQAPDGYEDADGFRLGTEPGRHPQRSTGGSPVSLSQSDAGMAGAA